MSIQTGCTMRFWTGLWHPMGRLIDITCEIGTQNLELLMLLSGMNRGFRTVDRHIQHLVHETQQFLMTLVTNGNDGVLMIRGEDDYRDHFRTTEIWNQLRHCQEKKQWSKIIWFSHCVLQFAFVAQLAIKDRLSTGRRMHSWSLVKGCLFCGEPDDITSSLLVLIPSLYGWSWWKTYWPPSQTQIGILRRPCQFLVPMMYSPIFSFTLHFR